MKKGFLPLAILLIAVFLARSMMPVGFMPDFSGKHFLTICSGAGLSTIAVDENNQPLPDQPPSFSQDNCPFSLLSSPVLADSPEGQSLIPAPVIIAIGMAARPSDSKAFLLSTGPRHNRGPPSLS